MVGLQIHNVLEVWRPPIGRMDLGRNSVSSRKRVLILLRKIIICLFETKIITLNFCTLKILNLNPESPYFQGGTDLPQRSTRQLYFVAQNDEARALHRESKL